MFLSFIRGRKNETFNMTCSITMFRAAVIMSLMWLWFPHIALADTPVSGVEKSKNLTKNAHVSTSLTSHVTVSDTVKISTLDITKRNSHQTTAKTIVVQSTNQAPITNANVLNLGNLQENSKNSVANSPLNRTRSVASQKLNMDGGAVIRSFYVIIGVTGVILAFFVLRAVRMRSRNLKSRKYGVISTPSSALELEPLDRATGDDEEEDTYFDAHHINRPSQK